jgi:capsular exopolysaccharide synthesis family protein
MELTDYIRILRKNWLIIVVVTLLGLGAAGLYSLTRTPLYEAESTVFVSTQAGSSIGELQQGSNFTQSRVSTYTSLVTTPVVINPVIAQLGLGMTAEQLAAKVTATAATNTTLITITVTDADPVRAADIANALGAGLTSAVESLEAVTTADGEASSPVKLTRVRDAIPPFEPSSPNVPLNLALGLLIGLALGVGIAVLRSVLDTRVRSPRDVELVTDRPMIGAIAFDPKAKDRPLIVHDDPLSPRAESFRALRTNLQFLDMGGRSSFVITSSLPNEGKSTTTINLAIALADAGKRVALLDTDLRKPKVAEYLGIEGGAGLTDVLIGRARLGDVMLPWGNRSMYVLPAGKVPPNPSELLGSKNMQSLLEALERDFDVVLCDAPPLLPVTDAAILAKSTSGAIVVVATGRTSRHQLQSAIDALQTVDASVAGIVLSMVPTRGPDSYGYGYGYGYGGYAEAEKPAKNERKLKKRKQGDRPVPEPVDAVAPYPASAGGGIAGGESRSPVVPPAPRFRESAPTSAGPEELSSDEAALARARTTSRTARAASAGPGSEAPLRSRPSSGADAGSIDGTDPDAWLSDTFGEDSADTGRPTRS